MSVSWSDENWSILFLHSFRRCTTRSQPQPIPCSRSRSASMQRRQRHQNATSQYVSRSLNASSKFINPNNGLAFNNNSFKKKNTTKCRRSEKQSLHSAVHFGACKWKDCWCTILKDKRSCSSSHPFSIVCPDAHALAHCCFCML